MELALALQKTPEEIEAIAWGDSMLLLERYYEREHDALKFEAALHGRNVK